MTVCQYIILIFNLINLVSNNKNSTFENSVSKINENAIPISYVPENLQSNVKAISTYDKFTCAIDHEDALYCWYNNYQDKENNKIKVMPIKEFSSGTKRIYTGKYAVCAENYLNEVRCFSNGYVDDGDFIFELDLPQSFNKDLIELSMGSIYICAVNKNQSLGCWNYNYSQKIKETNLYIPDYILNKVSTIHLKGSTACAISIELNISCWDLNEENEINTFFEKGNYILAQSNLHYYCALDISYKLSCWTKYGMKVIINKTMYMDNQTISMKRDHICALKNDKSLHCYDFKDKIISYKISNIKSISTGSDHNCILDYNGKLSCIDDMIEKERYLQIPDDIKMDTKDVKTSHMYTLAINSLGKLRIDWIFPTKGIYFGDSSNYSIGKISASKYQFCAITNTKELNCWQIYEDEFFWFEKLPIPIKVTEQGAFKVSVGSNNICSISTRKNIYCWQYLTDGTLKNEQIPNILKKNSKIKYIAVSYKYKCISKSHIVICWGKNKFIFKEIIIDLQIINAKVCYITLQNNLKCYNLDEKKEIVVPERFQDNVKTVSISHNYMCSIDKSNLLNCWYDYGGEVYVPEEVKAEALSVSSGDKQICSRSINSKLTCWKVDNE